MNAGLVIWTRNSFSGFSGFSDARKSNSQNKKNPIFLEFAKRVDDDFWKQTFEKYSRNMFPSKFFFRSNTLYYNYGVKSKQCSIDLTSLESNTKDLINFLNSKGITSNKDEIKFSATTSAAVLVCSSMLDLLQIPHFWA